MWRRDGLGGAGGVLNSLIGRFDGRTVRGHDAGLSGAGSILDALLRLNRVGLLLGGLDLLLIEGGGLGRLCALLLEQLAVCGLLGGFGRRLSGGSGTLGRVRRGCVGCGWLGGGGASDRAPTMPLGVAPLRHRGRGGGRCGGLGGFRAGLGERTFLS